MTNRNYTVYGNMLSDKSSENYPEKSLCPDCAKTHEIVHNLGPSEDDCEDCGELSQ